MMKCFLLIFLGVFTSFNLCAQSEKKRLVLHSAGDSLCLNLDVIDSITFDGKSKFSDLGNLNWGDKCYNDSYFEDFSYNLLSTYSGADNNISYNSLLVDGNTVYAVGYFGLRKIDYSNEKKPSLMKELMPYSKLECRALALKQNNLYVGHRVSWQNYTKDFNSLTLDFESVNSSKIETKISNNNIVNSFFKKFSTSRDLSNVASVCLFKAYHRPNGKYGNSIVLTFNDGQEDLFILGENYDTREMALNSLLKVYTNSKGDCWEVNWDAIPEGNNIYSNVTFNNIYGTESNNRLFPRIVCSDSQAPGKGNYCGIFRTDATCDSLILSYDLLKKENHLECSFWIRIDKSFEKVIMPLFGHNDHSVYDLLLESNKNNYSLSINHTADFKSLIYGEWYNIKATYINGVKTLYYRTKECAEWQLVGQSVDNTSLSINKLRFGLKTYENPVEVLLDNYYYTNSDIDATAYSKGRLDIVDKESLNVKKSLNLEYPITDLAVSNDKLIVSCLDAINIYNIEDGANPTLIYTYRPKTFRDIQGITIYENNGKQFALISKYTYGFIILDITSRDVTIVKDEEFDDLEVNGIHHGITFFNSVVDYPYVYLTYSPHPYYYRKMHDQCGVISVDISDLDNISYKVYLLPSSVITDNGAGDPAPTQISRFGKTLYINNREKGVCVYNILENGILSYSGNLKVDDKCSINAIKITKDGRMFVADDGTSTNKCQIYNFSIQKNK